MLIYIDRFNIREEFRHIRPTSGLKEVIEEEDKVVSGDDANENGISDDNKSITDDNKSITDNKKEFSLPNISRNKSRPLGIIEYIELLRKRKGKQRAS